MTRWEAPRVVDLLNDDADIRAGLVALGPAGLADLRRVLEGPSTYRDAILKALMTRPGSDDLATLIVLADTDEVVRRRLLQAVRDCGGSPT